MQDDTTQHNLDLVSIGDASEYLGISIDTLRRWEKKGRIVPMRSPGGHRYFSKKELDNLFGKRYTRDEETLRSSNSIPPNEIVQSTSQGVPLDVSQKLSNWDNSQISYASPSLPSWRSLPPSLNTSDTPVFPIDRPVREVKIPTSQIIRIVSQRSVIAESVSILTPPNEIVQSTSQGVPLDVSEKLSNLDIILSQSTKKYIAAVFLILGLILASFAWYYAWQKSQLILSPIP